MVHCGKACEWVERWLAAVAGLAGNSSSKTWIVATKRPSIVASVIFASKAATRSGTQHCFKHLAKLQRVMLNYSSNGCSL